jgi:hypothetical protein
MKNAATHRPQNALAPMKKVLSQNEIRLGQHFFLH